jgi:hypothetical protein
VNFKAESPKKAEDMQKERMVAFEGDQGIYRQVSPDYFRPNFEPDMVVLLSDVRSIEQKLSELEESKRCIENGRLIELTDKFEIFLEMMGRLADIDSCIKRQIEAIKSLRYLPSNTEIKEPKPGSPHRPYQEHHHQESTPQGRGCSSSGCGMLPSPSLKPFLYSKTAIRTW